MRVSIPTIRPVVLLLTSGWLSLACTGPVLSGEGSNEAPQAAVREPLRDRAAPSTGTSGTGSDDAAASPKRKGAATAEQRKLTHAGKERTAIVHVPAGIRGMAEEKPRPLMIVLHGLLADGDMTRIVTGFDAVADRHQFIVAYPDGLGRMWRFWEGTGRAPEMLRLEHVDDPGFLLHLIDDLVKEKLVDPRRVYLTGISNGGFMTNRMAWQYADRFAAIAPVAGTIPNLMLGDARPSRAVPTLIVHGSEDQVVEFAGSQKFGVIGKFIGARELEAWWAKSNRCGPVETTSLPDKARDGTTVKMSRHPAAPKEGAEVVFYEIQGGGHTWPGGLLQPEVMLGKTCRDWNASEAIWEFCSKHEAPAKP